jgi:hypothetical protein
VEVQTPDRLRVLLARFAHDGWPDDRPITPATSSRSAHSVPLRSIGGNAAASSVRVTAATERALARVELDAPSRRRPMLGRPLEEARVVLKRHGAVADTPDETRLLRVVLGDGVPLFRHANGCSHHSQGAGGCRRAVCRGSRAPLVADPEVTYRRTR